ncbi:MAG TPA: hypothetical protein VFK48_06795 [Usitatibacter sp.]|nr:hypothetical protein [Usitatibacter sp.]
MPHAADWLALGVIVTTLLTVRGFTVKAAVAGVVDAVSRTVSVTGTSAATGLGTTTSVVPVKLPLTGTAAWSLEDTR